MERHPHGDTAAHPAHAIVRPAEPHLSGLHPAVRGTIGAEAREFSVAIGEAAHDRHGFQIGDSVSGDRDAVAEPRRETANLYNVSRLRVVAPASTPPSEPPPWHGVAPALSSAGTALRVTNSSSCPSGESRTSLTSVRVRISARLKTTSWQQPVEAERRRTQTPRDSDAVRAV